MPGSTAEVSQTSKTFLLALQQPESIFSEEIFRRTLQMVHIIFHCCKVSYEAEQNELNRLRDLAPYSKLVFEDTATQTDANK